MQAWQIERIKAALEEAQSGAPGVPHEDVVRWSKAWTPERELPRPKPKK